MDNRLINNFNHTISIWISALEQYSFHDLIAKPTPETWSLGQVYMHLATETSFFIEQINRCISCDENAGELLSTHGAALLLANELPNEKIEGPPSNAAVVQPAGKQDLLLNLLNIKAAMNAVAAAMQSSSFKGKTKHPGFDYLAAGEWLQFVEIHLRHHLRQKKRLDDFLNKRGDN